MNIQSLENFKRELNQIKEYLKHIQYVNNLTAYAIIDTDNGQIKIISRTGSYRKNKYWY